MLPLSNFVVWLLWLKKWEVKTEDCTSFQGIFSPFLHRNNVMPFTERLFFLLPVHSDSGVSSSRGPVPKAKYPR